MIYVAFILFFVLKQNIVFASIQSILSQVDKLLPAKEFMKYHHTSPEVFRICLNDGIICVPHNYSKFELPDKFNATKVRYFKVGINDNEKIYNTCLIFLMLHK